MAILVTGAAGFIGSHVVRRLHAQGQAVVGVDNFSPYYDPALKEARVARFLGADAMTLERVDITDLAALRGVFERHKIEKICHLAAQAGVRYSLTHPEVYIHTNVLGTMHLLELARDFSVDQFVFASSSSVYGLDEQYPSNETQSADRPTSIYAATKRADELLIHSYHHLYKLKATCLRFFNAYGPWGRPDMALYIFAQRMTEGVPLEVYNYGKSEKDYTYVEDIADGIVAALGKPLDFEIINLGNGRPIPLLRYIELIEQSLGKKAELQLLPPQPGDVQVSCADIAKAKELLGYAPNVPVEEGVARFVEWFKDYHQV